MSTIVQKARPFFADEKRRRALEWEANSWVGTPFQAHQRLKGVGVDCVQLAAAIYIATGFLSEFNPEWYPIDGGHHDETSRVVAWIEKSGRFSRVAEARIGDLLVMKLARVEHHVGLMFSDREFVHTRFQMHVMVGKFNDNARRIVAIYRPLAIVEAEPALTHLRD